MLGGVRRGRSVGPVVRFLGQLRRSTEEETIVRVSRLAEDPDMHVVVLVDAAPNPGPARGPAREATLAPGPDANSAGAVIIAAASSDGSGVQTPTSLGVSPGGDAPRSYADGALVTSSPTVADPATTPGTDASEPGGPVQ